MKEKIVNIVIKTLTQIVFILFSLSILFGIYFLIVGSITPGNIYVYGAEKFAIPQSATFDNIIKVWNVAGLSIAFKNSVILGISTVLLTIIFGILGAYAFTFLRFRFKRILYYIIISTIYFSPMTIIIPLLLQFVKLGLNNTYIGVITIFVGLRIGFSIYLLTTFFRGIPFEIIEAATIDGSSRVGIIKNVILPLSTPALFSLALLNFNVVWNDLLIGVIFLQNDALRPIMVAIALLHGKEASNTNLVFAASLIATVPIMILYGLTQKYFIKGMTLGSVK